MDSELRESFSRTGTAHIFAISGLHVGFFFAVTERITAFMRNHRALRNAVRIILTLMYVIFTGASISALRAFIFAVVYLGCRHRGLRGDSIMVLCTAACVILLISPFDLFSLSFILSFCAVLGISLLSGVIRRGIRKIYRGERRTVLKIIDGLAVSTGAQAGVMLPMALMFNVFSPSAFVTNIIVIPITSFVYSVGFIANLFNAVLSYVPQVLVYAVEILVYILTAIVKWVSALPFAQITVATPSVLLCIAFCTWVYLISPERPVWMLRRRGCACLIMVPVIIALAAYPYIAVRDGFTTYATEGSSTAAFTVISPKGEAVVFCNGADIDDKAVEALKMNNGGVIDVLVLFADAWDSYNIWARDIKNVYICNATVKTYDKALESGANITYLEGNKHYKGKRGGQLHFTCRDNGVYVKMESGGRTVRVRLWDDTLSLID
ncbi:MAG: ComEC/Rec2 family competence protein [Clostridiales bacterium]|nr:ComEC/Rec2 family competence protein [Clostridiales bacterium]